MSLKYLSVFLAFFACVASATSSDPHPKNDALLPTKAPRVLTSAQDMLNYAKEISAINPKDHQRILAMAYPEPVIKLSSPCPIPDLEYYKRQRLFALNDAYKALIEQNTLDTALCIGYHEKNIAELAVYCHTFGRFQSQHESVNEQVTVGMFYVFRALGNSLFKMSALQNTPDQHEEAKTSLNASIEAYEKALEYGRSKHLLRLPELKRSAVEDGLLEIQKNLVSVYATLACFPKEDAKRSADKARAYCNSLKNHNDLFEKASNDLVGLEEALRLKRLASMPAGSRSREKKRKKVIGQTQMRLSALTTTDTFQNGFKDGIDTKLIKLSGLLNSKESEWGASVVKGLTEIENDIRTTLDRSNNSSSSSMSEVSLEVIYKNLSTLLGRDVLIDRFWKYIPAFIIANDVEGGSARIEIINKIEKSATGSISYQRRFVAAALKNLLGDQDEWIALEEELTAIDNKLKAKKKEAKKRAHQRKIEEIERSRAVPDKKSEEKAPPASVTPFLSTQPNKPNGMEEFDLPSEPEISAKQRKLEKLERHAQAEKERTAANNETEEEAPKQSVSKSSAPIAPLSKRQQRDLILQSSDKSLAELYNLSSDPLKVDQEIENNTWRFTREQFHNYVETMECTCKGGNGNHSKASLPKAMSIVHGDTLITVMNDFGGALTLPLWDKDYVPDYLKRQILEARKNLRALKIVALRAN